MRRQVSLEEIIETATFALRAKIYKIMPGIVVGAGGTAAVDVQPAVHDVRFDPVLGTRISEPWPVIPAVPVAWLQVGPFAIVGTLKGGSKPSKVVLLGFDMDPSKHRGTGNPEDPVDTSRHAGAYWVAIPADITDAGALSSPGAFLVLGAPGGVQVQIGDSWVSLGAANAGDFVALASKVDGCMNLIKAHIHISAAPSSPTGPPLTPPSTPLALPPTGSATVKCAP